MTIDKGFTLTWLGHSAFRLVTPAGTVVLIDPFLSGNPSCPEHLKTVDKCDLILLTHAHDDHLGDAIQIANQTGSHVIAIVELGIWLQSKGVENLIMMNKGGTVRFKDIAVTMIHAFHTSSITDDGQVLYGGEPAGYVIRLENGYTLYHAGDTNLFGDMALIRELYEPDLAMLPIGDHFTMGPREAAKAVRLIGARDVVPMHYGTFPVLTGTPAELRELTGDIEGLTVHELKPGDTLS